MGKPEDQHDVANHDSPTAGAAASDGQQETASLELSTTQGSPQVSGDPQCDETTSLESGHSTSRSADPTARQSKWPRIEGYEILDELGLGGMGVVYRALQRGLNRIVALKMIRAGEHAHEDEVQRFHTEAEAVAQLQHANIIQIFEVGEYEDGLPYFSMEYVNGESLSDAILGKSLAADEAAELMETLARAMKYAHDQGIVHRDLKQPTF